jgi:GAF domain-containing protein
MRRADLITQLAGLAVDLDSVAAPRAREEELTALCTTAQLAFGAAAVSVAVLEGDTLRYRSASGQGADVIVGTELPVSRGIAGYVALTGQALAVDRPADDPRFARDVAERTGYVPASLLVVPIDGSSGETAGVLSVLDRSVSSADALELATAFARQAAPIVETTEAAAVLGRVVFGAVVDAARSADRNLAAALARSVRRLPHPDGELAGIAGVLTALRQVDASTRTRIVALVNDIIELAAPRRRP